MDSPQPYFDLAQLGDALGRALSPGDDDGLVTSIADAARAVFGAAACSIALVSTDGSEVVFTTVSGGNEESVAGLTMPIGEGIVGWVATTGQAVAVTDLANDPRFSVDVATRTSYLPNTILACPVETDDRLIGVIEILDRDEARAGAGADLELLSVFARQAALAIDASARSYRVGQLLLRAFAESAGGDLAAALESGPADTADDAEMLATAAAFARLAASGPEEKALAIELLDGIGRYAARRNQ